MRLADHALYRLAVVGLGGVLLFLGGFTVVSADHARREASRLERATATASAFSRAQRAVQQAELVRLARARDVPVQTSVRAAGEQLTDALDLARRAGDSGDRRLADRVAAQYGTYDDASGAGDTATAATALAELDRTFAVVATTDGTAGRELLSFARDRDTVFVTTLVAFALGYGLLGLFGTLVRRVQERRRRAERERLEAVERFRVSFAGAATGMALVGAGGRFGAVNAALCAITGLDEAELLTRRLADLAHPESEAVDRERVARTLGQAGTVQREKRWLRADGATIWVRESAARLPQGTEGAALVLQVEDVTDRVRAEEDNDLHVITLSTIASVARSLSSSPDAREEVVQAARVVSGASAAFLFEPDGDGGLVVTALAGLDVSPPRLPLTGETSTTVRAFRSGTPAFFSDVRGDARVSQRMVEATGAVAALLQPVRRGGEVIGVLAVSWNRVLASPADPAAQAIELLAEEAATAIERGDFVRRLRALTRVDELTGVMNANALRDELPREIARARRDGRPLSLVAVRLATDEPATVKAAAAALRDRLRLTDDLAREDDGTFVAVLPACGAADAELVQGRLCATLPEDARADAVHVTWTGDETADALAARARARLAAPVPALPAAG